jgi:predicted membrane metal-binding protein
MKLQRTTLILLLLALSLGGFVYFYEVQGASQQQLALTKQQQIFSFEEEQVQAFTVKTQKQKLLFERGVKAGKSLWRMKAPSNTLASEASVSYLMNLLVKGKSNRTIHVPATQLQEYGLNQPQATIEVKLKNQQTHQLVLGKPDFNRNFLYAQADPSAKPNGNVDVLLVPTDFENAVNRQLSEWKSQEASESSSSEETTPKESAKASPSPSP